MILRCGSPLSVLAVDTNDDSLVVCGDIYIHVGVSAYVLTILMYVCTVGYVLDYQREGGGADSATNLST